MIKNDHTEKRKDNTEKAKVQLYQLVKRFKLEQIPQTRIHRKLNQRTKDFGRSRKNLKNIPRRIRYYGNYTKNNSYPSG